MSKRDITIFLIGIVCGGAVVGIGILTMSPLLNVEVVAPLNTPEQPRVASRLSSAEKLFYALDGFCPVTLVEKWQWKLGKLQFRETRGTQVFLFASSAEQKRFQEDPDRYLPAFSGNDIVLAKESGETIRGKCEHGIQHEHRIYLFATEESLQRFAHDPASYITEDVDDLLDDASQVAVNTDGGFFFVSPVAAGGGESMPTRANPDARGDR